MKKHVYNFTLTVESSERLDRGKLFKLLREEVDDHFTFAVRSGPKSHVFPRFRLRSDANQREHFARAHERYRQRVVAEKPRTPKINPGSKRSPYERS